MLRVIKYVMLVVLFFTAIGVGYFIYTDLNKSSPEDALADSSMDDLEANVKKRLAKEENAEEAREQAKNLEAEGLAKVRYIEASGKLKDARSALARLQKAISNWESETSGIETNSKGRWLASDVPTMQAYFTTAETVESYNGPEQADRIKSAMDAIEPLIEKTVTASYTVSESTFEMLATQESRANSLAKQYQESIRTLEGLVTSQKKAGSQATESLRDARAAWKENDTKLLKSEVEKRLAGLRKKEAERIEQEARDKVEHEALVREAQSSETKRLLAFFITPGSYDHKTEKVNQVGEKKPVSFSLLEQRGALEDSETGIGHLLYITGNYDDKERPLWPEWYEYRWKKVKWDHLSKDNRAFIKKVQEKLKKLGPTMVELEMLAP